MKFKTGVKLEGLKPETLLGMIVADDAYKAQRLEMTITSVNDSQHKTNSKHYSGHAFDIRTKDTGMPRRLHEEIKKVLSPVGFDVILEDLNGVNEHIHVEFDPKY